MTASRLNPASRRHGSSPTLSLTLLPRWTPNSVAELGDVPVDDALDVALELDTTDRIGKGADARKA